LIQFARSGVSVCAVRYGYLEEYGGIGQGTWEEAKEWFLGLLQFLLRMGE
jgi:hypothetical protein